MKLVTALLCGAFLCLASTLATPDPLTYWEHGVPFSDPGFVADHTHGHEYGGGVVIDPPVGHPHDGTSVPEPATLVLVGSALIGLGVMRKKI